MNKKLINSALMRKFFFVIAIFFSLTTFAQKTEGTIHFKDGTKKVGLVRFEHKPVVGDIQINGTAKFKTSKKSKELFKFEYTRIAKIDYTKNGKVIRTSYFKTPLRNPEILLEVMLIHEGDVNLYYHSYSSATFNARSYSVNEFYAQRANEPITRIFADRFLGKKSEKLMTKYFEDCPKLVEHIENETFKKYVKNHPDFKKDSKLRARITQIVKFYNEKCSANE